MYCYRPRFAFSLIELLVAIAIIGVLLGLLVVAVQKVRTVASRLQCANNLRQTGMAMHNFEVAYKHFPAGVDSGGVAFVTTPADYPAGAAYPHNYWSWMAQILPYIDQNTAYYAADIWSKGKPDSNLQWWPWGGFWLPNPTPSNPILGQFVPTNACPADGRALQVNYTLLPQGGVSFTSYAGVSGSTDPALDVTNLLNVPAPPCNGVLYFRSKTTLAQIGDGVSNTLLVGERPPSYDLYYGWAFAGGGWDGSGTGDVVLGTNSVQYAKALQYPDGTTCDPTLTGLRPGSISNVCDEVHFWSLHDGGCNFLLCDGSVRFFAYSANSVLPQLATRNGAEPVQIPN